MAMAVAQLRDEGPGEDDHGLCQGEGGDTKQEILKPGYEQIMDEIDPVSILGEAVDDWPAPCGETRLGKPRRNQHTFAGLHRARVSPRLLYVPHLKLGRRHGDDRTWRMVDDPLGRAATEYIQDIAMACGSHSDEIDVELDCHVDNRVHDIARPEHYLRRAT